MAIAARLVLIASKAEEEHHLKEAYFAYVYDGVHFTEGNSCLAWIYLQAQNMTAPTSTMTDSENYTSTSPPSDSVPAEPASPSPLSELL